MNVFVYKASLLCQPCGLKEMDRHPSPLINPTDSDQWPQGPYSDGGGEADCPQHCDHCGVFLENPLTSDGYRYVVNALRDGDGHSETLAEWADFYSEAANEVARLGERIP